MDIQVVTGDISRAAGDVVALACFEGSDPLQGDLAAVDQALGGQISQLIKQAEIRGKYKETTLFYTFGKLPAARVLVIGLGKQSELTAEKIRVGAAEVCKFLLKKNAEIVNASPFGVGSAAISAAVVGQAMAEGALLGSYTFRKHITKAPEGKDVQHFNVVESDPAVSVELGLGCRKGRIIAEGAVLARDLVNEPSNFVTPTVLAEVASQLAQLYSLEIKVMDREEMRTLGMGGLLGVAQGSQQPPKFIVLNYRGRPTAGVDIALVGKGITFDSGGISLKPSENMGDMKDDMAGAASVLGAIAAIAQLKPVINVAVVVPATENLPGGAALKPGDVVQIMNGKTVEIISTDAEGRLILADALSYARRMGARRLIDIATLTGACVVALGNVNTGAFSNDQAFVTQLIAAGTEAGEPIWQMPMNEEYKEQNKSDVADIKNTGGRYAGAITAAWFLGEFVEGVPWVHLDIAGTVTLDRNRGYQLKGATGVPVRTLINLVLALADK